MIARSSEVVEDLLFPDTVGGQLGANLLREPREDLVTRRGRWLEITVQDKRIEIGAVGPCHGAKLFVDAHLGEEIGISQRLEHRTDQLPGQIDIA